MLIFASYYDAPWPWSCIIIILRMIRRILKAARSILNIINFYTCIYIYIYIYTRMSVRNFVYSKDLEGSCGQYSVANCRCDVSAFDLRKSMWRNSKIDEATFEERCIAFRRSTIDVTMCRSSKIDVSTFGDRCVDLRRSMIDVSTFEDR